MKIKITPVLILIGLALALLLLFGVVSFFGNWVKSLNAVWAGALLGAMLIGALVHDLIYKKRKTKEGAVFLTVGQRLLGGHSAEFADFYRLYNRSRKAFLAQHEELLKEHDNFDFKNLRPIDILYLFAASKNLVYVTDWKGEENEHEIEGFLETLVQKPVWKNAPAFRAGLTAAKLSDARFTVGLLKAIDKDSKAINHRLLFFDLGWDAYVYTCVNAAIYKEVTAKAPTFFYGAGKLR